MKNKENKEKIRLYLGYAPGKTTALNGVLMRALGAGRRTNIILFSKCAENTSESKVYKLLKKEFRSQFNYYFAGSSRIREDGSFRFHGDEDGWTKEDEVELEKGINVLEEDIKSNKSDLLLLDELTDLVYHKKIDDERLSKLFEKVSDNTSIIITGHLCPDWLKDSSTTIVEGKLQKHYEGFTKGIEW